MRAVERELATPGTVRAGRILLERSGQVAELDDATPADADKSVEYVFHLLAAILPPEPLKAAFRGLYSEDRMLTALGLEFLEAHLPVDLVGKLGASRALTHQ